MSSCDALLAKKKLASIEYTRLYIPYKGAYFEEYYYLFGCNAVQTGRSPFTFPADVLPPSSESKTKPSKKPAELLYNCFKLVSCSTYSSP
jgi:hypothetical protein